MVMRWSWTDIGHEQASNGQWVEYSDYIILKEALREVLEMYEEDDGYEYLIGERQMGRISAFRSKFLID